MHRMLQRPTAPSHSPFTLQHVKLLSPMTSYSPSPIAFSPAWNSAALHIRGLSHGSTNTFHKHLPWSPGPLLGIVRFGLSNIWVPSSENRDNVMGFLWRLNRIIHGNCPTVSGTWQVLTIWSPILSLTVVMVAIVASFLPSFFLWFLGYVISWYSF